MGDLKVPRGGSPLQPSVRQRVRFSRRRGGGGRGDQKWGERVMVLAKREGKRFLRRGI